jgi:uncharacterized membrane protein
MFDIITALCTLGMVYSLTGIKDELNIKRSIVGGICLSLAVLAKLYPIIILPLALIYLRFNLNWLWFILSFLTTSFLISFPFFILDPNAFIEIVLIYHAERIGGGVTYWNGIWLLIFEGSITLDEARQITGFYLLPFSIFLCLTYVIFWKTNHPSIFMGTALVVWVFSFSFKLILEQYIVWILTFTLIYIVLKHNTTQAIILTLISLIIPILYLIISVPIPSLFYIEIIRQQEVLITQFSLYDRQIVLFLLGLAFTVLHLYLYFKTIFNSSVDNKNLG